MYSQHLVEVNSEEEWHVLYENITHLYTILKKIIMHRKSQGSQVQNQNSASKKNIS